MKKKKGFTLVELLAVIVILAVILIIAMPKISDVIKNSKESSLETTAKLIASQAEKKYTENQVLDGSSTIKCSDVVKLNENDYGPCKITFDDKGNAKVSIVGKGKFEGMAVCNANKNSATVSSDCSTDAKYFSYEEVVGGISITGYNIEGGTDVVIPSQIDGKTVVAIADYAFTTFGVIPTLTAYNNDYKVSLLSYDSNNNYVVKPLASGGVKGLGITSVIIPNTVTSIGESAFERNNLINVEIPSSVTTIKVGAFANNKLTNVEIPSSISRIGDSAFADNKLTNVTIPSSVTLIAGFAFAYNKITSITFPDTLITLGCNVFYGNPIMEDSTYSFPSNVTVEEC